MAWTKTARARSMPRVREQVAWGAALRGQCVIFAARVLAVDGWKWCRGVIGWDVHRYG